MVVIFMILGMLFLLARVTYPEDDAALQQYIQNNSIVVIKSCWGGSSIAPMGNPADTLVIDDEIVNSDGRTYYRTQWHWRSIIRVMQSYPNNFFVIWTGIPLVPGPGYDGTISTQLFHYGQKIHLLQEMTQFLEIFLIMFMCLIVFIYWQHRNSSCGTAYWGMNPLYHDPGDNHPNETGDNVVAQPFVWETFDAAIAYEGIVTC